MSNVKFTITAQHVMVGTDVTVEADADGDEPITQMNVVCDGFTLAEGALDPPVHSYERGFKDAASYTPGNEHTCVATATLSDGKVRVKSKTWVD